jgi:hypothetical protein
VRWCDEKIEAEGEGAQASAGVKRAGEKMRVTFKSRAVAFVRHGLGLKVRRGTRR